LRFGEPIDFTYDTIRVTTGWHGSGITTQIIKFSFKGTRTDENSVLLQQAVQGIIKLPAERPVNKHILFVVHELIDSTTPRAELCLEQIEASFARRLARDGGLFRLLAILSF